MMTPPPLVDYDSGLFCRSYSRKSIGDSTGRCVQRAAGVQGANKLVEFTHQLLLHLLGSPLQLGAILSSQETPTTHTDMETDRSSLSSTHAELEAS